jgi:hypothetical protein
MAWRDMLVEEILAGMTAMSESRAILEADSILAALVPRVFGAADALRAYQRRVGELTQQAQVLTRLCEVKDLRRDACHRAAYGLITADRDGATSEAGKAAAEEALGALYADGLALNKMTYQAQSGRDQLLAQALTPRLRAYLGGLRVTSATALALVEEALGLGPEVAALEIQRDGLLRAEDPSEISAGDVGALRLSWVQAMNALEVLLPMSSLDAQQVEAAMATVRRLADEAGKRAAERREQR